MPHKDEFDIAAEAVLAALETTDERFIEADPFPVACEVLRRSVIAEVLREKFRGHGAN